MDINPGECADTCIGCYGKIQRAPGQIGSATSQSFAAGVSSGVEHTAARELTLGSSSREYHASLLLHVRRIEEKLSQFDEKQTQMDKLRHATDIRAQGIANTPQRLDERLTTIQGLTETKMVSDSLSRAIEERFDKIAAEMRSLDVKTRSLDARLVVSDRKQEQAQNQIGILTENTRAVEEQIRTTDGRSKSLDEQAHGLSRRILSVEEAIRMINDKVTSVRSELEFIQEAFRKSDDKLDSLQATSQLTVKRVKEVESHTPKLQDRLVSLEERADAMVGRLAARAVKVAEVTTKLTEFEAKFKANDQMIRSLDERSVLSSRIPELQDRISELEEKTRTFRQSITGIVEEHIHPLRQGMRASKEHIIDMKQHADRMEQRLMMLSRSSRQPIVKKVKFTGYSGGDGAAKQQDTSGAVLAARSKTHPLQKPNLDPEPTSESESYSEEVTPEPVTPQPRSASRKGALIPTKSFGPGYPPGGNAVQTSSERPQSASPMVLHAHDTDNNVQARPLTSPSISKLKSVLKSTSHSGMASRREDMPKLQQKEEDDERPGFKTAESVEKSGFGRWLRETKAAPFKFSANQNCTDESRSGMKSLQPLSTTTKLEPNDCDSSVASGSGED